MTTNADFQSWATARKLATIDTRLAAPLTLASIWWALRSSDEAIRPLGVPRQPSEAFALTLNIEAPIERLRPSLIKTILDGVVSAMQSQTDQATASALAPRIAEAIPATAEAAFTALIDSAPSVLGLRGNLVNGHGAGVKWAPDDDYCLAARLLLRPAPHWRISGDAAIVEAR
jgi:hypothetical protein